MATTFDDGIKLSVPETAGRSIRFCYSQPDEEALEDAFVLCPEPSDSVKSYDDGLQTFKSEPMEFCSADTFVQCPEETPESVTSYDGGLRTLKPKSKVIRSHLNGIMEKVYLRFIHSSITQFELGFGRHSQYNKRPQKKPASKRPSISPYGILKKSDSSSRNLLPAPCLSSSLMFKVMLSSLFQAVISETQSLMYYHTGVFQQDKFPFKFEAVGFVNDQQIDKYDHDRKCDVPVASWMEKNKDESYWDRETSYRQGWEKVFQDNLRILKYRLNDSSVRPEVKVWGHRQSDGMTRLQCLVYGFHPRPVDVKWMRNGKDHLPSDEMTPILPHPDGTYQIRVSVEVPTKKGDTYSCHVDHSSLEHGLTVKWEPTKYDARVHLVFLTALFIPIIIMLLFIRKARRTQRTYSADPGIDVSA